jgi:tryptophan halogenase|tara:strand:- start:2473 stop:3999 length:1527 start_codon:yes stop_codon:yes gene_type:complete
MEKIIVLGGGSAGWMTAATLIKHFPDKNITLIESPNSPVIGVGESTLGGIKNWVELLGIDEKQFMRETDASFKLSIKFTDFYKKGEAFHYPFGRPNLENCRAGLNDWWFKKLFKPETPYTDYADCFFPNMALVNENKFDNNPIPKIGFDPKTDAAYHFDAVKFGIWLKNNFCIPKGVKHVEEEIVDIKQNEDGIESINGHKADLFIDCTGFKSLLLDKTLKVPFESYDDILINDSAWATKINYTDKEKQLVPYTNCTAIENGWVWNIPLWSRIGTGYVYSSKFVDDDTALQEFKNHLKQDDLEFKNIKMRIGIHKTLWEKNVVAIGLSAGFIEPLESNGLFSVHEFLIKLLRNLQRGKVSQWDRDNFTFSCKRMFRTFAEFVALHYALSHRDETPYWKYLNNKNWSKELINLQPQLIHGFLAASFDRDQSYKFETAGGLHCIAAGMHWSPTDLPSLFYENCNANYDEWKKDWDTDIFKLEIKKTTYKDFIQDVPTLKEYLENKIHNVN